MAAVITALTPVRGRELTTLVIDGTGFSAANNTVRIGPNADFVASISAQSTTQITVTVPAGQTVNFQAVVRVINNDDTTSFDRHWFVEKSIASLETDEIEQQQPGPVEDTTLEIDTVAEAKDYERLASYQETWIKDILARIGSGPLPNLQAGAEKIGTDAAAFTNITPARSTVQAALEAVDIAGGGRSPAFGDGILGDVTITTATFTDAEGDQNYNSLLIQTGAALASSARRKATVRVRTTLTLEGTAAIHADGRGEVGLAGGAGSGPVAGPGGAGTNGNGDFSIGGGGGGGGGGGADGTHAGGVGGDGGDRSVNIDAAGGGTGGTSATSVPGGDGADATDRATDITNRMDDGRGDSITGIGERWGASGGGGGGGGTIGTGTPGAPGVPGTQAGSDLGAGGDGTAGDTGSGGSGGASGAGAGDVDVWVNGAIAIPSGTRISANGGDGGDGAIGSSSGGGDGAGGGGGCGGKVRVFYGGSITAGAASRVTADGGTGGLGGTNVSGREGGDGGDGEDGIALLIKVV